MTSAMTFPQFVIGLNKLYLSYLDLPNQAEQFTSDGFFKRNAKKISRFFSDQENLNQPQTAIDPAAYNITPKQFVQKCIAILDPFLQKDISGVSEYSKWEQTSFEKVEELKKINSYTNAKKHSEIIKLLQDQKRPTQEEYFRNIGSGVQERGGEEIDDIEHYFEILKYVEARGMPLSMNEKINILEGKVGYWEGIMTILLDKKRE